MRATLLLLKYFLMPLWLVFFPVILSAQSSLKGTDRKDLLELMEKRQQLFNAYSESLKKKSGFFGQKTKNDLRSSQAHLKGIVEMDNRIMNVLNRIIDYKNFEKTNLSIDASKDDERLKNFENAVDTLSKQVAALEKKNYVLEKGIRSVRLKYYLVVFFWLATIVLYFLLRRNRNQ